MPVSRRVAALTGAAVLFAGVLGTAVLTFADQIATSTKWLAVVVVAIAGSAPIIQQLRESYSRAPWESYVSHRGKKPRAPEGSVGWALLGVYPGMSLHSARRLLGRAEDDIIPNDRAEATADDNLRQWRFPGIVMSLHARRDVIRSVRLQRDDQPLPRLRVALPRGVILGQTTLGGLMEHTRPPDFSTLWSAENWMFLDLYWRTGPEGTIVSCFSVLYSASDSTSVVDLPVSGCSVGEDVEPYASAREKWLGWPCGKDGRWRDADACAVWR